MNPPEGAFFSYVHADDEHESGRLTLLRGRLESEIAYQLGRKFGVWQDRKEIGWGQRWRQSVAAGVQGAFFFIPIITPRWFESTVCREEMELFLKREKTLKRDDLILPVIYQQSDVLTDEKLRKADPLAELILAHQWIDLVPLRFKPVDGADVREAIANMAGQLIVSIRRGISGSKPKRRIREKKVKKRSRGGRSPKSTTETVSTEINQRQLAARSETLTLVVDQMPGRGVATTISEVIANAPSGSRIVIRPGTYREALVLDKPLELIGEESAKGERVVVETSGNSCLVFRTNFGRVENIDFRLTGGKKVAALDIAQGQLVVVNCDVTSKGQACVGIHHGADPILRNNRIHDSEQAGVAFYQNAKGTLEGNDIFGTKLGAVHIADGADPVLRGNLIHGGKEVGVTIYRAAKGTLENNDIFENMLSGVEISDAADPIVRGNRIHHQKEAGVFIYTAGKGLIENNDIFSNAKSGILVQENGQPTLRGNCIRDNQDFGIAVEKDGRGIFEDNELQGNANGGWSVAPGAEKHIRRSRNTES